MAARSGAYTIWPSKNAAAYISFGSIVRTLCEVRSAMIALLITLLSVMSGGSHGAVFVNQAAPAAAHSQAVKRVSLPATGHPLAG
jgi:hypothetical protein